MYHIYEIYLLPVSSLHLLSAKFNNRSWMSELVCMYLYLYKYESWSRVYTVHIIRKRIVRPPPHRGGLGAQCMK